MEKTTYQLTKIKSLGRNDHLSSNNRLINKKRIKKNTTSNTHIIPLNIFQTWVTLNLPPKMKRNRKLLIKQNPEFNHYLYDDAMCRNVITKYFSAEVVYTFNKLKPGAFKADLWRYCVLYIHGGIYLDIKFKCVNNFKLIELTDREYLVKDKIYKFGIRADKGKGLCGVYQALISALPKNKLLKKCIDKIVYNVKNNIHGRSGLMITGPHIFTNFLTQQTIKSLRYENNWDSVYDTIKKKKILDMYPNYRKEQHLYTEKKHYGAMWREVDIYNYPVLKSKKKINLTRIITKTIMKRAITFYSGTPTIIELTGDKYLINIRWVNYTYDITGCKGNAPIRKWISLNSRFIMDKNFNKISNEIFLKENYSRITYLDTKLGFEDIRLFYHNHKYYYIASYFDNKKKLSMMSSQLYNIDKNTYNLKKNIISLVPRVGVLHEKNWSFVNYKNELCIIYKWFPLQIGKINYVTNKLKIIKNKNTPDYFNNARGSTPGFTKNKEIWFILHKTLTGKPDNQDKPCYNYGHFLAIFDLNMNLLRYSELFKLGDCKVEYCVGLIIKEEEVILSYSLLDTKSFISVYEIDYINNEIKWYTN
jgi:mannosyltransferase OCH1-like enzyme